MSPTVNAAATAQAAGTLARTIYRHLYPGPINKPDRDRTRESDLAEADKAYQTWDEGREGFAPGIKCRSLASALMETGLINPDAFTRLRHLDTLTGCGDDTQRVLTLAVKLAAYGATDDFVQVMAKVSARGCITNEDVHALERAGIHNRLRS